ncbi:unnamed protein product [Ambrosiozyma monospora]|uniref:Unnamed protein product n=1 Tax=Ambrosiozyma monospora TaxID=43982 RepID=A0ACB5TKP0_AMBMO|nr:unnamed protein product [Ambrosiozyma monospora]
MKSRLSAQTASKPSSAASSSTYATAPSSSSHSRSRSKVEELSRKNLPDVNLNPHVNSSNNNDRSFLKLEEVQIDQRDKLRSQLRELKQQREDERREFRKQELKFERQIDELKDKNNGLSNEISLLNYQLSSLQLDKKRESRLLEENQNLIHQVEQLHTALNNKNIEIVELKNELNGVKLQYEKLRTKQKWDSGKLSSKEDEIFKLTQQVALKDNKIQLFKNQADEEFHEKEIEIQRLLALVESLQDENSQLNKSLDAVQKDNQRMKQLNIDMKRKMMVASTRTEYKPSYSTPAPITSTTVDKTIDGGDTTQLLKISGEFLNAEKYRSSNLYGSNTNSNNINSNYTEKYIPVTNPVSKARRYSNISESGSSSNYKLKPSAISYKPKHQDDLPVVYHQQDNQLQSSVLSDSSTFNAGDENENDNSRYDYDHGTSKNRRYSNVSDVKGDTDDLCSRGLDDFDLLSSKYKSVRAPYKNSSRASSYTPKSQWSKLNVGGRGRMSVEESDTADLLNFDVL